MRLKNLLGPLPDAGVSALITLFFLLFFVGLCWFVYSRNRRAVYQHIERLPLEEDLKHD